MKCAAMLSPLRGVRAWCGAFTAFATTAFSVSTEVPFAVATTALAAGVVAAAGVDDAAAPAVSPFAVAPSWLLRDCRFDSRLLLLLPPPPGASPSCRREEDRCPFLLLLPLALGGEERPDVSAPPSR